MLFDRSTSAASIAPGELSAKAWNTRAYISVERRASARRSTITRCVYQTYDPNNTRNSVATSISDLLRRMGRGSAECVDAEIRAKRGRNGDRSVGVLMMLQQTGDRARKGQPRSVERVHESRLLAFGGTIPDVRSPRLEIGERAARRDLEPRADP